VSIAEGASIKLGRVCTSCNARIGVNRLEAAYRCHGCGGSFSLRPNEVEALCERLRYELPRLLRGASKRWKVAGLEVEVARVQATCSACGQPFANGHDACPACRCDYRARSVPQPFALPAVDAVVGEDPAFGALPQDVAPANFPCTTCGASLELDGQAHQRCRHCSTVVHIPEAFLRRGLRRLPAPFLLIGESLFADAERTSEADREVLDWSGPCSALAFEQWLVLAGFRHRWVATEGGDVKQQVERFLLGVDGSLAVQFHVQEELRSTPEHREQGPALARVGRRVRAFERDPIWFEPRERRLALEEEIDAAQLQAPHASTSADPKVTVRNEGGARLVRVRVKDAPDLTIKLRSGPRSNRLFFATPNLLEVGPEGFLRQYDQRGELLFASDREKRKRKTPEQAAKEAAEIVMSRAMKRAAREQAKADAQNVKVVEQQRRDGLRSLAWVFGGLAIFALVVALLLARFS
jgi:hypothetical protein